MKRLFFGIIIASIVLLAGCASVKNQGQQNVPQEIQIGDNNVQGQPANNTPTQIDKNTSMQIQEKPRVEKGDKVSVDYNGYLEDGTLFDSSAGRGPLEFEAGMGQMIKGFDNAVIGMAVGEEKKITLQPSEAYGEENPKLFATVPRSELPKGEEPKVGLKVSTTLPDGSHRYGVISAVNDENITINLNHPLAGKVLIFQLKLVGLHKKGIESK